MFLERLRLVMCILQIAPPEHLEAAWEILLVNQSTRSNAYSCLFRDFRALSGALPIIIAHGGEPVGSAFVAIVAVHGVPGVGQVHIGPVRGEGSGQTGIFPDEFPACVDIDDISHKQDPFLHDSQFIL